MDLVDVIALLLTFIQCPICLTYMIADIFQCRNGHSICRNCKITLPSCPFCRESNMGIRNLALERITHQLVFPCKYRGIGCTALVPLIDLPVHQRFCRFNAYCCYVQTQRGVPCNFYGPLHLLQAHLRAYHKYFTVEQPLGGAIFFRLLNFQPYSRWNLMISASEELFNCCFFAEREDIYAYLNLVGSAEEAKKYRYEIMIMNSDQTQFESYCGEVLIFYVDELQFLKSLPCFHTTFDSVGRLLNGQRFLLARICITKRSPQVAAFPLCAPTGRVWNVRGVRNLNAVYNENNHPNSSIRNGPDYSCVTASTVGEANQFPGENLKQNVVKPFSLATASRYTERANIPEGNAEGAIAQYYASLASQFQPSSGAPATLDCTATEIYTSSSSISVLSDLTIYSDSDSASAYTGYLPAPEDSTLATTYDSVLIPMADDTAVPHYLESEMTTHGEHSESLVESLLPNMSDSESFFSICSEGSNYFFVTAPKYGGGNNYPDQHQEQNVPHVGPIEDVNELSMANMSDSASGVSVHTNLSTRGCSLELQSPLNDTSLTGYEEWTNANYGNPFANVPESCRPRSTDSNTDFAMVCNADCYMTNANIYGEPFVSLHESSGPFSSDSEFDVICYADCLPTKATVDGNNHSATTRGFSLEWPSESDARSNMSLYDSSPSSKISSSTAYDDARYTTAYCESVNVNSEEKVYKCTKRINTLDVPEMLDQSRSLSNTGGGLINEGDSDDERYDEARALDFHNTTHCKPSSFECDKRFCGVPEQSLMPSGRTLGNTRKENDAMGKPPNEDQLCEETRGTSLTEYTVAKKDKKKKKKKAKKTRNLLFHFYQF